MRSFRNTSILRDRTGQQFGVSAWFFTGLLIKTALDKTKPTHATSYGIWL